jgi:hypothetical protein
MKAMDDLLITMIMTGIALCGVYLKTRHAWWRGCFPTALLDALGSLVLSLLLSSVSAAGEDAAPDFTLAPGMRVRILAPDASAHALVGTIRAVDRESVTIDAPGRVGPVSIVREKIARLDVSEGTRSRGVDALIGAGIGAVVGAATGAVAGSNKKGQIVNGDALAAASVLLGSAVGAVIGVAIPPGDRWEEIPAARHRLGLAARLDRGLDLAFAWRF